MKKVRYFLSSFLLLVLCLDIIRLPITIFSESVSATTPLTIRTKYIEHLKEDGQKLAIKLDTSQKQLDRLDVIVQIEEGVDISKGLSLVFQNELELESQLDEQGFPKEKLPPGFVKDEDYREEDVPKEFPEQEVAPTVATQDSLEASLPVYGLGYYSIKIKPEPERHIEWKVDEEKPERRYEEILLRLKIKKPLQTGQFMAVLSSDYKTILTEDWKTFEELVKRNSIEMVTDSVASDTEQPIPETSESTSDNTQSNPVPEGEEVIQEEQALAIQTANLRLVLREHEEGVLQPSKPIAGAEFSISSVENPEISYNGRTDEQGILDWKDLPLGEYQISQLSTAQGYEVEKQLPVIQLQESGAEKIIHVTNAKKNGLEGRIGSMLRSARTRRAITETNTDRTTTIINNPNGTTTTVTREEEITKDIFDPIRIEIPGVTRHFRQGGDLRKKEIQVTSTGEKKIIWEYITTVTGANDRYIKQIANTFMVPVDSGLGAPKITSIIHNQGQTIGNPETSRYSDSGRFDSVTNQLPIQDGTYVYTIETPILLPSENYTLDYYSDVKVQAPVRSRLTQNGQTIELTREEERNIKSAGSLTLPSDQTTSPYDTPKLSDTIRVNGRYRESNNKVIEWYTSRLNTTDSVQTYTFDVAEDKNTQAVHSKIVYVYEPTEGGNYRLKSTQTVDKTQNQITVNDVPVGGIAVVETITNVTNEKANHTITGASLEALKGDITIHKKWATGTEKTAVTFSVNGGSYRDHKVTLQANQSQVTVPNVEKFSGTGSTATKTRIYYEVTEDVPDGYALSTAQMDWKNLQYVFTNKKDTSQPITPKPPGSCESYGVTHVEPVNINWLIWERNGNKWGGFHGSLKFYFKLPAFAKEGDSFTIELPRELKLEHLANPSVEWTPVYKSGTNEILARTYHVEDRKLKFVLTSAAYSVTEYSGWFEIGSDQSSGLVQINNDRNVAGRKYLTGVRPEVPVWYSFDLENPINTQSNIVNKKLKYKTSYKGGNFDCSYTVIGDGTLNATENGSGGLQGSLRQFSSVHKQAINQTADSVTWELVYNGERNDITGGVGHDSRKIWDRIHENSSLYDGDVHTSIPRNIKVFVADGNPAASYTESEMVRLSLVATSRSGEQTTYHYGINGVTNMGLAILLKRESWYDAQFNYRSNYTLEFYHEGAGWGRKTIVARIKQRKNGNTTLRNAVSLNWNSVVLGGDKSPNNFFVAGDTVASGGAYPTGWYGFQLKKVDQQKRPLEGAVFTLYDSQQRPYQTIRSNEQGILEFTNILGGEYTFKEVEAPAGYTLDTTVHRLNIRNSENITINGKLYTAQAPFEIINKKDAKLSLKLKKKDLANTPLKGAVFRLRKTDGGQSYDETLGNTFESDEFLFNELTVGNYTLEEVRAPTGYRGMGQINLTVYEENGTLKLRKQADAANSQTSTPQLNNGVVTLDIYNQPLELTFTKQNTQGQPLENAIFELRQIHSTGFTVVRTNLFSKANGQFVLKGLLPNTTYELWETRAPDGYAKPTQAVVQFTVNEDGAAHFTRGSSTIVNSPPKFKVKIVKIDAETGQPITEGVNDTAPRFTVTNATGDTLNGQIANLQNGMYTFTNGSGANSGFEAGTYYLKEIRAPQGYTRLTNLIPFTIHSDGRVTVSEEFADGVATSATSPDTVQIKVKNDRLKTLRISKRIKGLEDLPSLITGQMTFTLSKDNDVSFQPVTVTQAANTDFVFNNLTYGSYTLVETAPPAGYMVEPIVYKVAVSRAGVSLYRTSDQVTPSRVEGVSLITSPDLSNIQSGPESNAIDGSETTSVTYHNFNGQGNTIPVGAYLGVDLQSVKRVRNIFYLQGNQNNVTDRMNRYTVEYSIDGETYYPIASSATTERFEQSTDLLARYIRVRNEEQVVNKWYAVRELRISAQEAESVSLQGGQAFPIGNIQHPFIRMEKRDSETGAIIQGTATFKLYKVPEDTTETTLSTAINDNNLIQTFQLANGQTGNETLLIKELGKYALVETQAPDGYIGLSQPVLLEATEARQAHSDTKNKHVTRFAVLSSSDKVTVDTSSTANDNVLKLQVKNRQKVYNLKILKRDAQNAQQGLTATFGLFNADGTNKIAEGQTNENDHSYTFSQLLPGTYVLKEERPPSGYIQVDPVRLEITQAGQLRILSGDTELLQVGASSGNTLQLTVKNDSKKTLRISKRIKGLESLAGLITGNMTFTLSKDNDASFQPVTVTQAANTDFVFNNLTYGSYTLVETAPPAGYMVEPITYKVSVSRSGVSLYKVANAAQIERVTGATLIKSPDLSNIQSGQDGDAIDGSDTTSVTYQNFNGQGDNIPAGAYLGVDLQGVKRVRHIHYLQGTQHNQLDRFNRFTLEYSIDGRTYFPLSTYTTYGLVDLNTDIVARYIRVRNEDRVEQKWYGVRELRISAQEAVSVSLQGGQTFPIGNIQHPEIQIEKQDMNNRTIQQAVTFKLYKVPDDATSQTVTGALTDQNLVQTFTLTNGQVRQALEAKLLGRYALVEVAPPTGYRALAGPVLLDLQTLQRPHSGSQMKTVSRFTLVGTNDKLRIDTTTENVLKIFVKNELLTYNLLIKKRDLANPNTGLDALFALYDANETAEISQGHTTEPGSSLTFRNLQPGTYVLKEVTAPTGYNPIQKIKLTISLDGQIRIVEGPQDLLASQAVNANNEIELVVKNRPFTDFSIEKVSNLTPTINLAGVQLQIKAKNNGPAPLFSNDDWHRQRYQAAIDTANKALTWWTQSNDVGNAVFKLPQGTYTISELAAPAGYELLQPFDIIVGEDGQVRLANGAPTNAEINTKDNRLNLKLTNIFKPKLKIIKVDSRNETRRLANATFKLFGGDGRTQVGSDLVTGATGEIETPALTPGTYYLQETQSPTGYQANARKYQIIIDANGSARIGNADNKIEVGTSQDQGADKIIPITVKNDRTPFTVKIRKRDYDETSRGLDARFQLYRKDGEQEVLLQGLVGNTSGANSELLLPNLLPNTYVLKEITAPAGNYEAIRPIQFTITEEGRLQIDVNDRGFASVENGGSSQELVLLIKNIKKFRLRIKKQDATNEQTLLDGANFTLYRARDHNGGKLEAIASKVTANGLADIDVGPGYFILQETQAPTGYVLNDKEYIFQINHDGTVLLRNGDNMTSLQGADSNRVVVFTMKNTRTTSQFKLAKRSYRDSAQRLEATFELKERGNAQAPAVVKRTTTTGDEVLFDNLPVGKSYILKETVAPDGYQKIEKEIHIDIGADGAITIQDGGDLVSLDNTDSHLIIVKNLRKGEYPKTGGIGIIPYIALGGVMMLLALAVELGKEKRWKHIRK
ncbi:TPA: discoidin domain-containing protein [Streptococcus suis]|nr:hypothetical protein [Streptococcus suis]HEM4596704.1 discoidin domain-containing protein [Streptococcus suis]